ncbi:pilus assembly protein PilY [Anaeromyxobacter sp. SG17]|uniref:pilus assembly protein PilY n=1 Tax=Anaeromyxobacter sp. SG17 TaxID=2925405 RepID=UPI001F565107|nr:pilus assembly protein PilY [Anaeromyxobacter sp. SG17]
MLSSRRNALRFAAAAAAAALLLPAADAPAETCFTPAAARGLVATSYTDTLLNGADPEDATFFTSAGGVPNIFILLGNPTSMRRLPPNGPSSYPGTRPPLQNPLDAIPTMRPFDADCDLMAGCPVMGCGDDPVSAAYLGDGSLLQWLRERSFQSPCGQVATAGAAGTYSASIDYAAEGKACPYYSQGVNATVPAFDTSHPGGYDPDFYCGSNGDTVACGARTNFFDKDLVYHDTVVETPAGLPVNASDGWTAQSVNPAARKSGTILAVDNFCSNTYGNADQGAVSKASICASCLRTRGFFLDGRQFRTTVDGVANVTYPSIYFLGNWLNFYPPKFVVARKIIKDVVKDKANVRMGLAHFGDTGADHTSGEWMSLAPTCDQPDSNWTASRSTYINEINSFHFNKGAPLARALLDIGQYYHTPELPWFDLGTTWNANTGTTGSGASTNQQSICYACQASSVIVMLDRAPASTEGNALPAGSVDATAAETQYAGATTTGVVPDTTDATGIPTSLCTDCAKFPAEKDWLNNPIRVAWYLHNFDLRRNNESTEDCAAMGGKQVLDVYTLGLGAIDDGATMLQSVARMGGGAYEVANDAPTLKQALENMFLTISERSTSFSVATVSTLQTTSGQSVIVPRFEPGAPSDRLWQGHLLRYELYSEFINACQETADGTGAGDLDCDGKCLSVFLKDKDGDFIQEDGTGAFRKNDPPDAAPCYQASACIAKGGTCAVAGTGAAAEYWDAQKAMRAPSWLTDRRVYTVVDDAGPSGATPDGKIDAYDTVFRLEPNDIVATKLLPYLALESGVCTQLALKLGAAGDALTANAVSATRLFCAKTLIRYVLGADVFNENEAKPDQGLWPKAADDAGQDTLPNRFLMLGDIFHSAPVVVDPPLPPDGILCPNGLHNQCLTSLWGTPVPDLSSTEDAYAGYAKSDTYKNRRKVVVVGANDGLLHAFDGGAWVADADDPTTTGIDERKPPFNGYYTRGTGAELWALLPPDLLPKVGLLLQGHQLFVDGSPMVRDVWVDGTENALGSASALKDGKKGKAEFHTVAVVAERRGGTHYFGLDLTDATKLPSETGHQAPRFLWIYPQPTDKESLSFGATYADFLPVGPPIGPVRIKSDSTSNGLFGNLPQSTLTMSVPGAMTGTTTAVPYHERWVALLSGGFDPQFVRGRGVHMVDVWTGDELFDFSLPTQQESPAPATDDPRWKLRAPVPATAAMVVWGKSARRLESSPNDGYFDTATFGDAAGQLWVLRFSDPGELDAGTKKVTNWYGARAFELEGCAGQPFFYITANAAIPGGILRTFAGTGDRYNLLDRFGGTCGPDNVRACVQRGCTVTIADATNSIWSTGLGKESGAATLNACTATGALSSTRSQTEPSATACTLSAQAKVSIDCTGANDTEKNVTVACSDSSAGLSCTRSGTNGLLLNLGDSTSPIQRDNWFISARVFGDDNLRPVFRTAAEAKTYDTNRIKLTGSGDTATPLVLIDGNDTAGPFASATDAGWALHYNHDGTMTADDHTYPVSRYDERTSSTTALFRWLSWNTIQTASQAGVTRKSGSSCQVAQCTAVNRRVAYHYIVDPVRGSPVLDEGGTAVFARAQNTLVPTMGDQATVFVNQKGQVQVGLTAVNPEKGASNVSTAVSRDPVPSYGVIQVSKQLHDCRHNPSAPNTCK